MIIYTTDLCPTDFSVNSLRFQVLHVQAHAKLSAQGATVVIKKKIKTSSDLSVNNQAQIESHQLAKKVPITYNFPVPTSGVVVRFKVTFEDQRVIESKCFPADEAKEKYEQALKDPLLPKAAFVTNHTDDLFSVFIGNFDADITFEVETEYVCSLEYDTQYSGLRFSIPTTVFPRYGDSPMPDVLGHAKISLNSPEHGIFISVEYVGDDIVQSFSCVSHKEAQITRLKATYANEHQFLEKDFVTILKLKKETTLSAVYEPIFSNKVVLPTPALKNVLSVNFNSYHIPELIVPSSSKKEIIFIIDRSGSMHGNIETLKAAMSLFVSSFPNDETTIFNIISFGSDYKMLWQKSKTLNAKSFDEVQSLIRSINADMGGTEVLEPIQQAVKSRRIDTDAETEIVLLTDGEIFNVDEIRKFIQTTKQKFSNIRFFSFGIGDYVSHALLDAIAGAGKGCKQTVMNGERMEQKVIKLLKICLSVPITSVDIIWNKASNQNLSFTMQQVPVSTVRRDSSFMVTPELGLLPITPTINSKMYIFFEKESDLLENVSITLYFKDGRSNTYTAPITKEVITSENSLSYLSVSGATNLIRDIKASNLVSEYDKTQIGEAVGLLFSMTTTWTSLLAVEKKEKTGNHEKPLFFEKKEPIFKPRTIGGSRLQAVSRVRMVGGGYQPIGAQACASPSFSSSPPGQSYSTVNFKTASPFSLPLVSDISDISNATNSTLVFGHRSEEFSKTSDEHKDSASELPSVTTSYEKLTNLVKYSNFDGSFKADKNLIFALTSSSQLTEKHQSLLQKQAATGDLGLLAVLVLLYLKLEVGDIEEAWTVLSEKVKKYVERNVDESVYTGLI